MLCRLKVVKSMTVILEPIDNQNVCPHNILMTHHQPTTIPPSYTGAVGCACCNIVAEPSHFCRVPVAKVVQIR